MTIAATPPITLPAIAPILEIELPDFRETLDDADADSEDVGWTDIDEAETISLISYFFLSTL